MSQSRGRRAPSGARGAGARDPPHAGDHGASRRQDNRSKSRNRNKIPKSVRYDLENALLGLCDVWFEEIKPHLVRNNIKLHVDALEDSGEGEGAGAGDHRRACAHVDPGAAPRRRPAAAVSAGCCPTRRPASKTPSLRPPGPAAVRPQSPRQILKLIQAGLRQPPAPAPRAQPSTSPSAPVQHPPKRARSSAKQNRKARRARHAQPAERAPRAPRAGSAPTRPQLATPPPRHSVNKVSPPPRSHQKTFQDKATQTILTWRHIKSSLTIDLMSPTAYGISAKSSKTYPLKHEKKKRNLMENTQLYPYDLVDIIGAQHDKRLRVIFKNPNGEDSFHSILYLDPSGKRRIRNAVKRMPWR